MTAQIEPAPCTDAIRALLVAQRLPVADLDNAALIFLAAQTGGKTAGVIGIEPLGEDALLRSLAVDDASQRRGIGVALVAAAEHTARERHVGRLYLLTTTAEVFFARLGYVRVDRDEVPSAVAGSAQFAALCPASAVVMVKALA